MFFTPKRLSALPVFLCDFAALRENFFQILTSNLIRFYQRLNMFFAVDPTLSKVFILIIPANHAFRFCLSFLCDFAALRENGVGDITLGFNIKKLAATGMKGISG